MVGCSDNIRVSSCDSVYFFVIGCSSDTKVRVKGTLLLQMSNFPTADALDFLDFLIFIQLFLLFFILVDVSLVSTSRRILLFLTTAPPHKTAPLALVGIAGPVEVFGFFILLIACFTVKNGEVDSLTLFEFLDFVPHSDSLFVEISDFLIFVLLLGEKSFIFLFDLCKF